jgi:hypothetical protein
MLRGLFQEFYGVLVRVVSEMFIKGEYCFNSKMIYQSKAGAIGKTEPLVIKAPEDDFRGAFSIFSYPQNNRIAFGYSIHECNSGCMAAPCFQERITSSRT